MATARTQSRSRRSTSESSASKTSSRSVASLQDQQCENCTVGVLQVIRYDPDALHEEGQDLSASNQHPSGGAYETQCGFCGQRLSHPLESDTEDGGA